MAIKQKKIKLTSRERRKGRIRKNLSGTEERPRISVFRSTKHTYAQVVSDATGKTLFSASTTEKEVMDRVAALATEAAKKQGEKKEDAAPTKLAVSTKSVLAARAVGLVVAERSLKNKFVAAVFDRNGFLYCGRVSAVADGAREGGLKF